MSEPPKKSRKYLKFRETIPSNNAGSSLAEQPSASKVVTPGPSMISNDQKILPPKGAKILSTAGCSSPQMPEQAKQPYPSSWMSRPQRKKKSLPKKRTLDPGKNVFTIEEVVTMPEEGYGESKPLECDDEPEPESAEQPTEYIAVDLHQVSAQDVLAQNLQLEFVSDIVLVSPQNPYLIDSDQMFRQSPSPQPTHPSSYVSNSPPPDLAQCNLSISRNDSPRENPIHFPYTVNPSLIVPPLAFTPEGFFDLLFTPEFLNSITLKTNIYANELMSKSTTPNARIRSWKTLEVEELKTFLGIVFMAGDIKKDDLKDYWTKDEYFETPGFRKAMPRDRFLLIHQCLHFEDNPREGEPTPQDRLYKIRPVLEYFVQRMREVYSSDRNLSLDESMVLWRGRLRFRQYLNNKAHKHWITVYHLTEKNGLVLRSIVYSGEGDIEGGGEGVVGKVVKTLLQDYLGKGYAIYMDNFYNSVKHDQELQTDNLYCAGTLRSNRKHDPVEVCKQKLKKGEIVKQCTETGMSVLKWRDNKEALLISTEYSSDMTELTNTRRVTRRVPPIVKNYNENIHGVDNLDLMMSIYSFENKTDKWYKKLGYHYFQLLLFNSFILYNKYSENKLTLKTFRSHVIKHLVVLNEAPLLPLPPSGQKLLPIHFAHYPTNEKFSEESGKSGSKQRQCTLCLKQKKKKVKTIWFCPACPGKPALCHESCFVKFHID